MGGVATQASPHRPSATLAPTDDPRLLPSFLLIVSSIPRSACPGVQFMRHYTD